MCSATPLLDQLAHGATYGLAVILFGAVALILDLFSRYLEQRGADRTTVRIFSGAVVVLVALDVAVVLGLALNHAWRQLLCLWA